MYANSNCSRKSKTISSESKNKLDNYEWIYDQRIIQKKSIEQIAKELSISTIPVVKYLKKHKIHGLIDSRRRNSHSTSILSDKEKLEELYKTGLTCDEIGEQIGVAKSTVARWLNIYEIAIEYNGLYSHQHRPSESKECLIKGKSYHLNKTLMCEKQGIQLLQFYSDEWLLKGNIVKSVISSKLNINEKIYARKCKKVIVDTYTKNEFLNRNHMQGEDKSKIKIGLTYEDELVCVMTFCKSRFNRGYEWELSRFSNKIGVNVIGGFSRLLSWFREDYEGNIVSYADKRYSNGNVYYKNGFDNIRVNGPSYYYIDRNCDKRYNRMMFQKKLIGAYDCTEYEKARELGYNKIYDCGTICFGLA